MFDYNKIKALNDKVNAISTTSTTKSENVGKTLTKCKILGFYLNETEGRYYYQFEAIDENGDTDSYGICSDNAICLEEIGQETPSNLAKIDDIVFIQSSVNGYEFSISTSKGNLTPMLDLTHTDNSKDTWGWKEGKKTVNGEETGDPTAFQIELLVRQHYDSQLDKNIEYYIILKYDDKGYLSEVSQVQQRDGFRTTLHT